MATQGATGKRISPLQRRLIAEFDKDPEADPRVVAARIGCAPSGAYTARKLRIRLLEEEAAKEGTLAAAIDPIEAAILKYHARLHVDDLLVALAFVRCVLAPRVHMGPAADAPAVREAVRIFRQQHRRDPDPEWVQARVAALQDPESGRARVASALAARGYRLRLHDWPEMAAFASALAEPVDVTAFYRQLGATSPLAAAKAALADATPAREFPSDSGLFDPKSAPESLPDAPETAPAPAPPDAPPDPALLELATLPEEDQEALRQLSTRERAELEHAQR